MYADISSFLSFLSSSIVLMIINLGFLPWKQRPLRNNCTKAPQIRPNSAACTLSNRDCCHDRIFLSSDADRQFDSVLSFLALMLSGSAPIIHMFLLEGFKGIRHFPLLHIACMELCYFVGTVFYLTHWPERHWPEIYDIWVSVYSFPCSTL